MAGTAIALLWLLIGAIFLACVIALLIYGVEQFIMPIPDIIKRGIWFVFLLLIIIYLISAFMGGGVGLSHPFR